MMRRNPERGVIVEKVNIHSYPQSRIKSPDENKNIELTIGDLHANAIKLLFFLIKEGVLDINLDLSKYDESIRKKIQDKSAKEIHKMLVEIFLKDPDVLNHPLKNFEGFSGKLRELTSDDLAFFDAVIANATVKSKPFIRLLGDECADRSGSDNFVFGMIKKLGMEKIPFKILISNHGFEFIVAYYRSNGLRNVVVANQALLNKNDDTRLFYEPFSIRAEDQSLSLHNLGCLIQRGLVDADEIQHIFENYYLPNLKVIDYTEMDENKIRLHTHAPVDIAIIKGLAKALGVNFQDTTVKELENSIDEINSRFLAILNDKNLANQLFTYVGLISDPNYRKAWEEDPNEIAILYSGKVIEFMGLAYYFRHLIWNRDYSKLKFDHHNNYQLVWDHGHTTPEENVTLPPHVTCFDNTLGQNISLLSFVLHYDGDTYESALQLNETLSATGDYKILREQPNFAIELKPNPWSLTKIASYIYQFFSSPKPEEEKTTDTTEKKSEKKFVNK